MVGKTNLPFISKGEGSSVQLMQKSYVIGTVGAIYKMEEINGKLFVFVGGDNVMMGSDINHLEFIKKDGKNLEATHVIYADNRYYLTTFDLNDSKGIYATSDFEIYEEIDPFNLAGVPREKEKNDYAYQGKIKQQALFLDINGRIIFMYKADWEIYVQYGISICKSWNALADMEIVRLQSDLIWNKESFLIENKIYIENNKQISLDGQSVEGQGSKLSRYTYADGYFFRLQKNSDKNVVYRSRDGINFTMNHCELLGDDFDFLNAIIPINGRLGSICVNKADSKIYLNIAADIMNVGAIENDKVEIFDSFNIRSVVEYGEKTYVGTDNGIIYEFQLDYEGTLQRPDVAIIKTMSAKQALAQSVQYTDECIERMKQYIEDKIQENLNTEPKDSTEVE